MDESDLDYVGYWTEIKLKILREYAAAYALILKNQSIIKHVAYIDGFAGAGTHVSKATHEEIEGSPAIALRYHFNHYHFVDLDGKRIQRLKQLAAGKTNVSVYQEDCNKVLLKKIFPTCRYEDYCRALCLLDPYKLNPRWEVVQTAGTMRSIEIFLNFMIMDANMNAFLTNPDKVTPTQALRMNEFWGDDSWRQSGYQDQPGLFGPISHKRSNLEIVSAYRHRLQKVAGFQYVPEPLPMKNQNGATIYYLFFASHNYTGYKIATSIFNKFRN